MTYNTRNQFLTSFTYVSLLIILVLTTRYKEKEATTIFESMLKLDFSREAFLLEEERMFSYFYGFGIFFSKYLRKFSSISSRIDNYSSSKIGWKSSLISNC